MTKHINRSSCAFHAIAASLALCSTPLFAQEVSPAAPAAASANPAPIVVLPTQSPVAEPVAAATVDVPDATAAVGAPTRAVPKARAAPAARPAAAPRVARQAATSTAPVAAAAKPLIAAPAPVTVTPALSTLTRTPAQAAPAPALQPEAAQPADNSAVLGLGALAALGIAGLGLFATRRRRTIVASAPVILEPIDAAPAFAMPAFATPAFVPQPAYATYDLTEPAADNARPIPGHNVSMPDGPVPTGDARQQLIDRMVAAAPDAANPFTSVKGRRHRARLILQAREHEQQLAGSDGFDWRKHPTARDPVADRTTVDA